MRRMSYSAFTLAAAMAIATFIVLMASAPVAAATENGNFIRFGASDRCIAVSKKLNKRKAPYLVLAECKAGKAAKFMLNAGAQLVAKGKCVDPQEGGELFLYNCGKHPEKVWTFAGGKLVNRGNKKCMGFSGDPKNSKTVLKLTDCKKAPTANVDLPLTPLATVMGVSDKELPGLGKLPFQTTSKAKGYTVGKIQFLGRPHTALVFAPKNAKKKILSILPTSLALNSVIPSLGQLPINKGKLGAAIINIVVKGAAASGVAMQTLPPPIQAIIAPVFGKRAKVGFTPGLSLTGMLDISQSPIAATLKSLKVKDRHILLNADLTRLLLAVNHAKPGQSKALFARKKKDALAQTKVRLLVPEFELPMIGHILEAESAVMSLSAGKPPVLNTNAQLALPNKTLPMRTQVQFSKDGSYKLIGRSNTKWNKAFEVSFITMEKIGLTGSVNPRRKEADLKLTGMTEILRKKQQTTSELLFNEDGINDFRMPLTKGFDVRALPGFNKIPGIKEFSFTGLTLSRGLLQGQGKWPRLNITGTVGLMALEGAHTLVMKTAGLEIDRIIPKAPPMYKGITLPKAVVFLSTKEFDEVSIGELPGGVQAMLADLLDDPESEIPIFKGIGFVSAFTEKSVSKPLRDILQGKLGLFNHLEGPLLLTGEVSDFPGKLPEISATARLPEFKFPKNQPLARVIKFNKTGRDFFLRLISADTKFQAGVGGDVVVSIPRLDDPKAADKLKMRAELMASADLVSLAGSFKAAAYMEGKWQSPLGLSENFAIENPAIVFGADAEGSVEMGIGGNGHFKTNSRKTIKLETDLLVNINFSTTIPLPKKLGVRFAASEWDLFSQLDLALAMYKGVLTGPMAAGVIKVLPKKDQAVAKRIQQAVRNKDTSMKSLLKIDQIPFPNILYKDVEFMFATPGSSIPGRDGGMDGFGLVMAGEAELQIKGKKYRLGKTENRLTMADGLVLNTEISGFNVGPLKIDQSTIGLTASLSALPSFQLKSKAKLLGASSLLDIDIMPEHTTMTSRQQFSSLLDFNFKAEAVTRGLKEFAEISKTDFRLDSNLRSDPQKWLQTDGVAHVRTALAGIGSAGQQALATLNKAQGDANRLSAEVAKQRTVVRNERKSVQEAIGAAKRQVDSIQARIGRAEREIAQSNRQTRRCNQSRRICIAWFFGCKKHINVPDLPARGICEIRNAPHRAHAARYEVEKQTLNVSKRVADKALALAKSGVSIMPVDADPRVLGPLASRDVAHFTLDTAKRAVAGADQFDRLMSSALESLKVPESFKLEKGIIKGSLREAVAGKPVILEIDFTSFGKSLKENLAFSLTDAAYNAQQLGVLALGIATNRILEDMRKIKIIPHHVIGAVEKVFADAKAVAEADYRKSVDANGGIQVAEKDGNKSLFSLVDAISRERAKLAQADRLKAQKARADIFNLKSNAMAEKVGKLNGAKQVQIQLYDKGYELLCLENTTETNARGATKIIFQKCNTDLPKQTFLLAKHGEVYGVGGRCLDYQENNELWLYECTGNPGMIWRHQKFELVNVRKNLCITSVTWPAVAGTHAKMDTCDFRKASVYDGGYRPIKISVVHPDDAKSFTICLTSDHLKPGQKAKAYFGPCTNSPSNILFIDKAGRIFDESNRCLERTEDTFLEFRNCNPNTDKMRYFDSGRNVFIPLINKCVRWYGLRRGGRWPDWPAAELDTCGDHDRNRELATMEFL